MFVLITRKSLNINELRARAGENNAKKNGGFCKTDGLC